MPLKKSTMEARHVASGRRPGCDLWMATFPLVRGVTCTKGAGHWVVRVALLARQKTPMMAFSAPASGNDLFSCLESGRRQYESRQSLLFSTPNAADPPIAVTPCSEHPRAHHSHQPSPISVTGFLLHPSRSLSEGSADSSKSPRYATTFHSSLAPLCLSQERGEESVANSERRKSRCRGCEDVENMTSVSSERPCAVDAQVQQTPQ